MWKMRNDYSTHITGLALNQNTKKKRFHSVKCMDYLFIIVFVSVCCISFIWFISLSSNKEQKNRIVWMNRISISTVNLMTLLQMSTFLLTWKVNETKQSNSYDCNNNRLLKADNSIPLNRTNTSWFIRSNSTKYWDTYEIINLHFIWFDSFISSDSSKKNFYTIVSGVLLNRTHAYGIPELKLRNIKFYYFCQSFCFTRFLN